MDYESLAMDLARRARERGADEADVMVQVSTDFSVEVRKGEVETLTQAGSKGLGLRCFLDRRQGFSSTSDFDPNALDALVDRTIGLARIADPRPENGLPEDADPQSRSDLGLYDPAVASVPTAEKIALARRCEEAALGADPRIDNSEGSGLGSGDTLTVLATSRGELGSYRTSACSLYCQPLAEENGKKQVDYEWCFRHAWADLEPAEEIGRKAAARVLRKLGARKISTCAAPVIFDRRVATRVWQGVLGAVDGDAVFKGMSFLKDRLGERVAAESVTLVDDGTLAGGAGSAPFDGDGLPTRRNVILDRGVLRMFLYDTATARKVGADTRSTANARRSYNGLPGIGPFNLFLQPGELAPEEIIRRTGAGLFVTDLMGAGANTVTGDFSIGAAGLWIENGEIAFPVEEVTIACSMDQILNGIERIGADLFFNSSVVSPTFQVAEMTISGS
jgi:PmbA protein